MPHIREVRLLVHIDENGKESEPILQQRNGLYGFWEDVPVIKTNSRGWKDGRIKEK